MQTVRLRSELKKLLRTIGFEKLVDTEEKSISRPRDNGGVFNPPRRALFVI